MIVNKSYIEWIDYYENATKEDVIQDMMLDINSIKEKDKEIERLKKIAHKMHLWIFLHSGDEQKVYDELGLTDEENAMLGYSGQFRIGGDDESE